MGPRRQWDRGDDGTKETTRPVRQRDQGDNGTGRQRARGDNGTGETTGLVFN